MARCTVEHLMHRSGAGTALLVPNSNTKKLDDQYRRAHWVVEYAPVAVSECKSESEREFVVREVLQLASVYVDRRCSVPMNDAERAAEEILSLPQVISLYDLWNCRNWLDCERHFISLIGG